MIDALKIRWDEGVDTQLKDTLRPKGNFLCAIGTKEGKVMIYRFGPHSDSKLFQTKGGYSFGAISDVDMTPDGQGLIAGSESGEMLQYNLGEKLNADN